VHEDKGPLHGITVVVDTAGSSTFVGRCFEVTDRGVVLLDADRHDPADGGGSRDEYLRKVAQVGQWSRIKRIVVPAEDVVAITKLTDLPY